ncbi:MAG: prephenate dehydrogenase [Candidatus Sumerlaeia bacterium]
MAAKKDSKPHFSKVTIAGVGLLGASLGMALMKRRLADRVVGVGRNTGRLERAVRLGAIDSYSLDLEAECHDSDLIVLCGPVSVILKQLPMVFAAAPEGALITDVGSTKASIVATAVKHGSPGVDFVGSHPMAGSEKSGAEWARADLYTGATCILTPDIHGSDGAVARMRDFWEALGMRVIELLPEKHDRILALVSHLPHLVANGLVAQAELGAGISPKLLSQIAGPGFRDTTRIAMGSADMWLDIFMDNAEAMLESIERMQNILAEMSSVIKQDNREELREFLEHTAEYRQEYFEEKQND